MTLARRALDVLAFIGRCFVGLTIFTTIYACLILGMACIGDIR